MEFKRIEKEIKHLEQNSNVDCLEYNGKELLKELKKALSICRSSIQLKNDTIPTFEDWYKSEGYEETNKLGYYKKENKNIAFKRLHYKYYTTVFF